MTFGKVELGSGVQVSGLSVSTPRGPIVEPISFSIDKGQTMAIIGESGSGKSMTAKALTGLLPAGIKAQGSAVIDEYEYDLSRPPRSSQWARVRGRRVSFLLQDPFTSLSPVIRCGKQIEFTIRARARANGESVSSKEIKSEVEERLAEVNLSTSLMKMYPAELSGGMRQRLAIAAALAANPSLLIADEPTTALDATTQGEVLDLLQGLRKSHNMSLILISHDLGVVSGRADEVVVMKDGNVVEVGTASDIIHKPQHGYTRLLVDSIPSFSDLESSPALDSPFHDVEGLKCAATPLATSSKSLVVESLSKSFGAFSALKNASLTVRGGEILAVVGESGSGKSTLARCISGLEIPDEGNVRLSGRTLQHGRKLRRPEEMQVVFQDPYSTLNPSLTVAQTIGEAVNACPTSEYSVVELLDIVGLDASFLARRPNHLSGGQRQRVAIARALAPNPDLLICDECVSALDVSVQDKILDLLLNLRNRLQIAIMFITHDLGVVARVADQVVVMSQGEIVERGSTISVLKSPENEYTRTLVAAAEKDSIQQR